MQLIIIFVPLVLLEMNQALLLARNNSNLTHLRVPKYQAITNDEQQPCPLVGSVPQCIKATNNSGLLFAAPTPKSVFDDIYDHHKWGRGGESLSGAGSSVAATKQLCGVLKQAVSISLSRKAVPKVSILDAPSGDFNWMPVCLRAISESLPTASLSYQGVDVSASAINLAEPKRVAFQQSISRVQTAKFQALNLAEPGVLLKKFGQHAFDVIVSHDALQHNPKTNIQVILQNYNSVGKTLVVDVDRAGQNAYDIGVGKVRYIDIMQPPYSFSPICMNENQAQHCDGENEWFGIFNLPLHRG